MAYSNILPRSRNITGSDCTGSDGVADRTYVIPDVGILSSGMDITVNGTTLHEGAGNDFTLVSDTVTFLNIIDNTDVIRINYFITIVSASAATLSTSTSLKYATPTMLAEMLGMKADIPSWDIAGTPTNEEVGLGDNSETVFYLDQRYVLSDSYTLYYGADATATDELTETTHYSIDNDTGKITLTAAGVTLLGTDKIYAEYSYINISMTESYLISVLTRAEKEVDNLTNSTFTDGTTSNPSYPVETEMQTTDGLQMDRWITKKKPLIDISSTLDGDLTIDAVTIDLASGDGTKVPSSGTLIIGSEVITYTGVSTDQLTGVSRGTEGSTAAVHSDGDAVHSTIVFISDTEENTAVSWTVQPWDTNVYVDDTGLAYRFKDSSPDVLTRAGVANRFKMIYLYGYDTVPNDITRLALIIGKRMLIQDNVGKSMIQGRNEFRPEMFNIDINEMKRIVDSYIVFPMGNT